LNLGGLLGDIMTIPEIELSMNRKILGRLDTNQHGRVKGYRLICPVCKVRFEIGDKVVRTNSAKYVHKKCYPLFRCDSDIEISDEELDNFFIINQDMLSSKELRKH
jgi:hypothetical protein